jgi:hypothetical protein
VPIVLKSGSLNLLESSGSFQASNWTVLPLPLLLFSTVSNIPPLLYYHIHLDLTPLEGKVGATLELSMRFPFRNQTPMDRKLLSRPFYQSLKGMKIALGG